MPFKFEAFERVAKTTPRARIAAACNTLRFDADGWLGDNTDGAGLVRDIERNAGVALRGARILLIGAGGGAAGALGPLLASGASEVVVANRSVDKARALVDRHADALDASARARVVAAPLDRCGEASTSSSTRRRRASPALRCRSRRACCGAAASPST
jgi:shikimate dehydrogenase